MGTTAPDRERSCRMEPGSVGERPLPTVICGPSGVGKGTLISKLMKEYPDKFGFAVSHTTRKPRYMEQDGVHYHFTHRSDMEAAVRDGKFLESAEVHGNLYGTSIAAVEAVADVGKRCILDIDVQGAEQVKKSTLDALFIFISPPTFQELEARLRGRGTETEEQIQKRLKNAKAEMERSSDTTLFAHLLVNDAIENTYKQFKKILGLETEALVNGFHRHGTALTTYPSPQRTLEKIDMGEILSNGNGMTRIEIDTNVQTGMVQGFNGIFRRLSRWRTKTH